MYLHHILTRSPGALISQVLWAQVAQPVQGDWCKVVEEDMKALGMNLKYQDIAMKSKETMKTIIKKCIKDVTLSDLISKKGMLKKMMSLSYSKVEMQEYLTAKSKLKIRHKRLYFRWRTRMIKVSWNFGKKVKCLICQIDDDTQEHLLVCPGLITSKFDNESADVARRMMDLERALRKREILSEEL